MAAAAVAAGEPAGGIDEAEEPEDGVETGGGVDLAALRAQVRTALGAGLPSEE